MPTTEFIAQMPKVELHVHLEGSIRPETLLKLAKRNGVVLPATTVEGLREWYRFRDFKHFVAIYVAASSCIRTPEDIELIACEFVDGQVAQNVLHSEVTYTAETIQRICKIPWPEQFRALKAARDYAQTKGTTLEYIVDIVREIPASEGIKVADWAISGLGDGICALGLSGVETKTPASRHREAFRRAKEAGLKISTHAGETGGPAGIWDCLETLQADRIGHGIHCLGDEVLVDELRERQIPLEVCPSSNVCLGLAPSLESHPIGRMVESGLNISVNTDDPPMFNTSLTQELQRCVETFGWSREQVMGLQVNAARAAFVSQDRKAVLESAIRTAMRPGLL